MNAWMHGYVSFVNKFIANVANLRNGAKINNELSSYYEFNTDLAIVAVAADMPVVNRLIRQLDGH